MRGSGTQRCRQSRGQSALYSVQTRRARALMAAMPRGHTRREGQKWDWQLAAHGKPGQPPPGSSPAGLWCWTDRGPPRACFLMDRRPSWRRLSQIFTHSESASRENNTKIQFAVFLPHCKIKSKFHSGQHGRLLPEITVKRLSTSKLQNYYKQNKSDMGENLYIRVCELKDNVKISKENLFSWNNCFVKFVTEVLKISK